MLLCVGLNLSWFRGKLQDCKSFGIEKIVIILVTNLPAVLPVSIAMYIFTYTSMSAVALGSSKQWFYRFLQQNKGDSIHLAPEHISPAVCWHTHLYQNVFASVIPSCYGKIYCVITVIGSKQKMDPEEIGVPTMFMTQAKLVPGHHFFGLGIIHVQSNSVLDAW